jgi:hypothetical protein
MIASTRSRAFAAVIATTCCAVLACSSAASAAQPWWHLSMGARPTLLHAPTTETQEIRLQPTAPAEPGAEGFLLVKVEVSGGVVACVADKAAAGLCPERTGLTADRTAAQLRGSLEGVYGLGAVQVSGGPAGAGAFTIATPEREVAPIKVSAVLGEAQALETGEGGSGRLVVVAFNLGDASTSGPVTVADMLPSGLTATRIAGTAYGVNLPEEEADKRVTCTLAGVSCTLGEELQPYERLEAVVWVTHPGPATGSETNTVTATGGGARPASRSQAVAFGEGPVPFGAEAGSYEIDPEEEGGAPDHQTGSHPFQLTTTLRMNETSRYPFQPAMPRNLQFDLPAGLVGDTQAMPQCTYAQFMTKFKLGNACPADTAVGVSMQQFALGGGYYAAPVPVFNLTPARGEPARFGFWIKDVPILLNTAVRSGGDYGVTVNVRNLTEVSANVLSSVVSVWGDPGAHSHDMSRGWECVTGGGLANENPGCASSLSASPAFLTLPSACEALQAPMRAQSWQPGAELLAPVESTFQEMFDSCNRLPFDASIETAPDVQSAASPSGLKVDVHVPQEAATNPEGLTDSDVRDITVALPAGVSINPGGGNGLGACGEQEIGFQGAESGEPDRQLFTATLAEPFCPDNSKIGTVKITTPLLPNPLEGSVYLANPADAGEAGMNPFDGLVAMYIVAEDPVSGTIVKLPGNVGLCEAVGKQIAGMGCEAAGQIVTSFKDSPQLPFEDAELHFFGGENAPLATPSRCGSYTTHAVFAPWSGGAPVASTSTFEITSGAHGGPCPGSSLPFAPEFTAGTVNNQAGAFSELRTTMGHPDADQPLGGLTLSMPPGVMGSLAGVALCGEPQAAQGTCRPGSLIGHTTVTAGLGSTPAVVKRPGSVYITGPYNGHGACTVGEAGCAPFGLSIANPAEAGPFDLEKGTPCDCIVVRAKVEVDPLTAQLKIVTGALPTMLKGIPLDLQHIMVGIDRSNFTFNPTGCEHESFTGTLASGESGATAPVSTPFQAANCANLAFKPTFKVSTSGKTSRLLGASLNVKLTYPKGSLGSEANLHYVKVDLPKQLPSNLEALKHACPAATFESNPAACDPISKVGSVVVHTQVLPVPLEGPAIFVSYGGAKFPELVFVLQGYGVTVDVHGETFIDKAGITSSTIRNAPDVPFESFELNLPQRPKYAALAAPFGLCNVTKTKMVKKKVAKRVHGKVVRKNGKVVKVTKKVKKRVAAGLVMPTHFIGQNGAEIKQNTPIEVTGCARAKKKAKAGRRGKHRRKHK